MYVIFQCHPLKILTDISIYSLSGNQPNSFLLKKKTRKAISGTINSNNKANFNTPLKDFQL